MRRFLLVAVLAAATLTAPAAAGADAAPTARTPAGVVRGVAAQGAEAFLGIPYAAPPTGNGRWRPPRPAAAWDGVRDATRYGPRCAQLPSGNGVLSTAEDCLTVNVHRPAGTTAGDRLPVFVFVHGGALLDGGGAQYDGALLARTQRIVVVTLNYRLGAFGFLALPGLTAEAGESGNYGLQDQQAALRWVRDSIGGLGGDPARVTIGGESAGGFSVCAHLAAPGSRGLFRAAVVQSGGCLSRSPSDAAAAGRGVAERLGCRDAASQVACVRSRPAALVLAASALTGQAATRGTPTLPLDPRQAVREGRIARVPVLIGANLDEGRGAASVAAGWGAPAYLAAVLLLGAGDPDATRAVLGAYPWRGGDFAAAYGLSAVFTDAGAFLGVGGCATRTLAGDLARHVPVHEYEFAHRDGPGVGGPAGYRSGAAHTAELPYLWPSFGPDGTRPADAFGPAERALSAELLGRWGAFVRTGSPQAAESPAWPEHGAAADVLQLRPGGTSRVLTDAGYAAAHRCDVWDRYTWPTAWWTRLVQSVLGVSVPG